MGSTHPRAGVAALAAIAVALVALTGCGGDGDAGPPQTARAQTLKIADYTYQPAALSVPKGTVLKIENADTTAHTVSSKASGVFESGSIDAGGRGSVELDQTGTFAYYCLFHPFMKGTVKVE